MIKFSNLFSSIAIAAFFLFFPKLQALLKSEGYPPNTGVWILICILVLARAIARWLWYKRKVTEGKDSMTIKKLSRLYLFYYFLQTIASISILIGAFVIVCGPMLNIHGYVSIFIVCLIGAIIAIPTKIKINKKIHDIENKKDSFNF